jgi:hypothetical protein
MVDIMRGYGKLSIEVNHEKVLKDVIPVKILEIVAGDAVISIYTAASMSFFIMLEPY